MVKEVRCIVLDRDDIVRVVGDSGAMERIHKDASSISRVDLAAAKDGVVGTVHFYTSEKTAATTVDPPDMLEAVLMFCRRKRIPLPMRCLKTLSILGDSLVLDIKKS